jgi:hypothetical protein
VTKDKPFANLYYIVELPGVLTYIALTSYSPGQTFDHNEEQYKWLEQQLQKVRPVVPWYICGWCWWCIFGCFYRLLTCIVLTGYSPGIALASHQHLTKKEEQ